MPWSIELLPLYRGSIAAIQNHCIVLCDAGDLASVSDISQIDIVGVLSAVPLLRWCLEQQAHQPFQ